MNSAVLKGNTNCGSAKPADAGYINTQDAAIIPPVFFRRALKIVKGQSVSSARHAAPSPVELRLLLKIRSTFRETSTLLRTVRGAVAASRQPSPETR